MAVTVALFRENFPEFANDVTYTEAAVTFWLTLAGIMLNASRWKSMLDYGTQLFVAHHLVLEAQAQAAASKGNIPGTNIGVVTAKSIDKVSVGMDAAAIVDPKDGHWNMSTYGLRFIWMMRMVGAGPIQVGVGYGACTSATSACNAWAGPWPWNFPSMNM